MALVAANDIGHVARLKEMGVGVAEIRRIRREDRRIQGVTAIDEKEARRAISMRTQSGPLTIIETTSATSSAFADLILPEFGGPGYEALLVVMPGKLGFFGPGLTVMALARAVKGSWSGGAIPERGYWGATASSPKRRARLVAEVVARTKTR